MDSEKRKQGLQGAVLFYQNLITLHGPGSVAVATFKQWVVQNYSTDGYDALISTDRQLAAAPVEQSTPTKSKYVPFHHPLSKTIAPVVAIDEKPVDPDRGEDEGFEKKNQSLTGEAQSFPQPGQPDTSTKEEVKENTPVPTTQTAKAKAEHAAKDKDWSAMTTELASMTTKGAVSAYSADDILDWAYSQNLDPEGGKSHRQIAAWAIEIAKQKVGNA